METDKSLSVAIGIAFTLVMLGIVANIAKAAVKFTVSNLVITPSSTSVGQIVTISCTVSNISNQVGSYTVTLSGDVSAIKSVTLNSGESTTVSFEVIPLVAKTYLVSVDGLSGTFVATTEIPIVYTCPICGTTFSTYDELYQHFITEHPSIPIIIVWE